jgi:hypothetical protein
MMPLLTFALLRLSLPTFNVPGYGRAPGLRPSSDGIPISGNIVYLRAPPEPTVLLPLRGEIVIRATGLEASNFQSAGASASPRIPS